MLLTKIVLWIGLVGLNINFSCSAENAKRSAQQNDDDNNNFLDMATTLIQMTLNNQNSNDGNGGSGLATVASLVGSFMQTNSDDQSKRSGSGLMQIFSVLNTLLAQAARTNGQTDGSGGAFDPALLTNMIDMFTQNESNNDHEEHHTAKKRETNSDFDFSSIMQLASTMLNQNQNQNEAANQKQKSSTGQNDAKNSDSNTAYIGESNSLVDLLPLIVQAVQSFTGPEGQNTQDKHKGHAWVLPPFLEQIHVLWDHFSNSELGEALYERSGVNQILKGFKGHDGKLQYDKLFESLNNQSFRRRWIKTATLYLADWASYLAKPEVYSQYFRTAQLMFNGFLQSQGYPKNTFFDANRPSETISNLLDRVVKEQLNTKIDSRQYVKPAVAYAKELLKLGQARGLLQFNATDLSDKLTDSLNLEVIEPVLKVHRAYRFILQQPQCDRYVLCQLNAAAAAERKLSNESRGIIAGVSTRIIKIGSMGAAFFISTETGTPFATLFSVINAASDCELKYPVDCNGFHEGEARVTTEYAHNEL